MELIKLPSMSQLYEGRTIFLTGATGFVGKVLIEKMLYSLSGIKRIYVLIRERRGKSGAERWKEFEKLELFNRIRNNCPERLSKVVVVEGDISLPNLGIADEDLGRVIDEASIVFHCAATVRFNALLKEAVELNMRGIVRVISLCKRMPKLECLLHCSTCYVNADKQGTIIEEKLYPPPCDPYKLLEASSSINYLFSAINSEWMRDSISEAIGNGGPKSYGNTYCFTKALAEHLVVSEAANLPAIIIRPSIVGGIWRDGIPGWADALQGAAGMAILFGTGALTRIPIDLNSIIDGIPVDIVSSSMIVCAGYRIAMSWGKLFGRICDAYVSFQKFLSGYTFTTDNLVNLMDMMSEEDKEIDVRKVNWKDLAFDAQLGVKAFIMKDDIVDYEKIRKARRTVKLVQLKDFVVTLLICYICSLMCSGWAGTATAWHIILPISLLMHCYFSVFIYTPCGVPSIHDYKRRVEAAMGEPLKPLKRKY